MCVVFLLLYNLREQNHLITDKRKPEEQWLGLRLGLELFFVLYFSVLYFSCCIFCVVFFHVVYIASVIC